MAVETEPSDSPRKGLCLAATAAALGGAVADGLGYGTGCVQQAALSVQSQMLLGLHTRCVVSTDHHLYLQAAQGGEGPVVVLGAAHDLLQAPLL